MNADNYLIRTGGERRREMSAGSRRSERTTSFSQVIVLAALSDQLPADFITESLAQTVLRQTGDRLLVVRLQTDSSKLSLRRWGCLAPRLNGEFALAHQVVFDHRGIGSLHVTVGDSTLEPSYLRSLLKHLRQHFRYVFLQADPHLQLPVLVEAAVRADRAFLFLRPTAEGLTGREALLREVRNHPDNDSINLKTIVCRESGEEKFNQSLKEMGAAVHGFIHGCPPAAAVSGLQHWNDPAFEADLRRLAREILRCRVGLVLSSGGARGLAHIGVIQVLEENGIEIDVIAGCSMGAYIGAVWGYGYDGQVMERLAREVEHRWGLFELIDPFILPRQGFLRGEKVKRRLKKSIGDVHFSELSRPLRIVATNLSSLERAIFSTGEVATAVHASSAIPGACAPVRIDRELYIDGGIADPLPVDVLEDMGIERIIAVNTIPTPAYLRCRMEMEREQEDLRGKRAGKLRSLLNQYLNYFAPGNILDTILRSIHG
ncbi:MAG TPA: patatin-like phospholipase family protein, partial [Verrucomicrobiae bacterium]|nr:patatin-like phospholipase family protein [Verrucomicrobiae bacterium]